MITATLTGTFTSTGEKLFAHQEAMRRLRNGQGQPIVTHLMPTDICNHSCAFCSVQTRAGNVLPLSTMRAYLEILVPLGLKAVILSGGGNPILYRDPETHVGFDALVAMVRSFGLDVGLITNGAPLRRYPCGRQSWKTVAPETLDELTWVRISMAGLDHAEEEVYVPDIDESRTTLGFSYVLHDIYLSPGEPNHGKVSTVPDVMIYGSTGKPRRAEERIPLLTQQIRSYVWSYRPRYVRLLPNCLEPTLIERRCTLLQEMANDIDPSVVFVQHKPPRAPSACYLGYVHPVLNSDGYVYPCDSVVLNTDARKPGEHDFGSAWRMCRWDEVGGLYERPIRSLIHDPAQQCPGCVFTRSNALLDSVVQGAETPAPIGDVEHVNFV
jgi:MoaA/NifB/PqqE/SkfB family radical SAM enzyme